MKNEKQEEEEKKQSSHNISLRLLRREINPTVQSSVQPTVQKHEKEANVVHSNSPSVASLIDRDVMAAAE